MKRNIIIICISSLLLIGIIVTIIVISNRKYELKIDSFDYKTSLSFGKLATKEGSLVEEYASITYEVEDVNDVYENVIKKSEYFKFEVENDNSKYSELNKDGYYYKAIPTSETIILKNYIDLANTYHFASPVSDLTWGEFIYAKNTYYYYIDITWEDFLRYNSNNEFNVVDKNSMISFYNSISNELAYYNEQEDIIYLRSYQFFGSPRGNSRCSEDYNFRIEFTETGYQLWYTGYTKEEIENDIYDFYE